MNWYDTPPCPHCGHPLPESARSCRHCGYSEEYSDAAGDDGLGLDDEFDYDAFVAREFPDSADPETAAVRRQAWIRLVVAAVVASFVLSIIVWGI